LLWLFWRSGLVSYLSGLVLNCDPSDLSVPVAGIEDVRSGAWVLLSEFYYPWANYFGSIRFLVFLFPCPEHR
jgi:hypothetical protein